MFKSISLTATALTLVAALARPALAATNYLQNANFNTVGGNGSQVVCTSTCPSAAADWLGGIIYDSRYAGSITTTLVPSTLVAGGTMIHVQTSGLTGVLSQTVDTGLPAKKIVYGCAWIYITPNAASSVLLGVTPYLASNWNGVVMETQGHWEVLITSSDAAGLNTPPASFQIAAGGPGGTSDFYVESGTMSTSQGECKPN